MKKHFQIILCLALLLTLTSHLQAQTVYVTEKGKKYHKKNCAVAGEGKKGMELKEAKKKGYAPCGSCKPDPKETTVPGKKSEATEPKKK